jgi:predicted Fe-S protein YdhL (DUF1289 family)
MSGASVPPLSPCVRICVMDASRQFCTGCRRTLGEIARWWGMRDDEKRAVLAALPQRRVGGDHDELPRDPREPRRPG